MDYIETKLARRLVMDGRQPRPGDEALFYDSFEDPFRGWRACFAFCVRLWHTVRGWRFGPPSKEARA